MRPESGAIFFLRRLHVNAKRGKCSSNGFDIYPPGIGASAKWAARVVIGFSMGAFSGTEGILRLWGRFRLSWFVPRRSKSGSALALLRAQGFKLLGKGHDITKSR